MWAVLNCNKLSYIIFFNFKRKRKTRYFIFEREAKQVNGIESQQRILEFMKRVNMLKLHLSLKKNCRQFALIYQISHASNPLSVVL